MADDADATLQVDMLHRRQVARASALRLDASNGVPDEAESLTQTRVVETAVDAGGMKSQIGVRRPCRLRADLSLPQ
jgi:hypothetical protein